MLIGHLYVWLVYLICYHGAKVAEVAGKAEMSEVAGKAEMSEMSEMPEMSEGMSSMSISEMEPCPSRVSR
jgi:hypothetical protein